MGRPSAVVGDAGAEESGRSDRGDDVAGVVGGGACTVSPRQSHRAEDDAGDDEADARSGEDEEE